MELLCCWENYCAAEKIFSCKLYQKVFMKMRLVQSLCPYRLHYVICELGWNPSSPSCVTHESTAKKLCFRSHTIKCHLRWSSHNLSFIQKVCAYLPFNLCCSVLQGCLVCHKSSPRSQHCYIHRVAKSEFYGPVTDQNFTSFSDWWKSTGIYGVSVQRERKQEGQQEGQKILSAGCDRFIKVD